MFRRSSHLTPALLAANRTNAQKSTRPRTRLGRQRSATDPFALSKRPATRMKPECHSKQGNYEIVAAIADLGLAVRVELAFGPSANVFAPCTGPGTRRKPECYSKQVSYENLAPIADLGAAIRVEPASGCGAGFLACSWRATQARCLHHN